MRQDERPIPLVLGQVCGPDLVGRGVTYVDVVDLDPIDEATNAAPSRFPEHDGDVGWIVGPAVR